MQKSLLIYCLISNAGLYLCTSECGAYTKGSTYNGLLMFASGTNYFAEGQKYRFDGTIVSGVRNNGNHDPGTFYYMGSYYCADWNIGNFTYVSA